MVIINEKDWESLGRQFQSAEPFPSICIDNFLNPEFAVAMANSYPDFFHAQSMGREFRTVNERLKIQITEPDRFPDPVKQLSQQLGSDEFLKILTTITGIENLYWDPKFSGGGMHLTGPTGILDVHVDFNFEKKLGLYRRLNILIYLNQDWDKSWGGAVEFWDRKVQTCFHTFYPTFNRCVLFETSDYSFHGVTQVKSPPGVSRISFAAYYYSEKPGNNAGEIYGGFHSTIFKARPAEFVKKYWSMPIEKFGRTMRDARSKVRSLIK